MGSTFDSEELIGEVLSEDPEVMVATKVGPRIESDGSIYMDYSRNHILASCEGSLRQLKRECIDFYQLHTAKVSDLENGESIEALEQLKKRKARFFFGGLL